MVKGTKKAPSAKTASAPAKEDALCSRVRLSEIVANGDRFEASAFAIEARQAVAALQASKFKVVALLAKDGGFCREAHNAFRFRRIYVDRAHGVPFLSSSDIISVRPEIEHYVSRRLTKGLPKLLIHGHDVLISCSGTVGNVGLAGKGVEGYALSQHAIRLRAATPERAGYVAAFLRTKYGRRQLKGASYGSVVVHIEPEHLRRISIIEAHPIRIREIGTLMVSAVELRDEANQELERADVLLHSRLRLPPLHGSHTTSASIASVAASSLGDRFEASYHDPLAAKAIKNIRSTRLPTSPLGAPQWVAEIRPITKFRERTYVRRGGIPLVSSKQMFQVDPIDVKRLAKGAHTKDLVEIAMEENMILITRSGTIGRVQIAPKYMDGWAGSEHATRVIARSATLSGYLYAWLASDYGKVLLTRSSYGSVILEIDKEMIASIPVPVPDDTSLNEISALVLRANVLRNEAWELERQAIAELETLIEQGNRRGATSHD